MRKEKLEIQAARYAFGNLTTDQMQMLINGLLNAGLYIDEFLDVVEPEAATREIVGAAFEKALKALGVAVPHYEAAVWCILHHHISRIAEGQIDALEGLQALINEVYWRYDFQAQADRYLGDSHGIEHLIGLYWEYDEFVLPKIALERDDRERRTVFDIETDVVVEAQKWIQHFAG